MAVTAAELNVVFAAETSDLKRGANEAQGILKNVAATAGGMLAAQAFVGIASGLKDLGAGMITANAQAETLRMNLDIAAGSMERGGKIFSDLQKLAANTPFEFPELMQSAIALESLGVNAMDYIELLGNTAAATGKSLDQVTQAFLDAQMGEFERLKEFGIRATVEGDKVLFSYMTAHGQVTKEVEKGNTAMYQSTLEAIWNEKYAGAMGTLSQSFMGQWSTLKDNFNLLMQEMGKPLFEFAGAALGAFNQFFGVFNKLREKGVNIFQSMWSGIRKALRDVLGKDNPVFLFIKDFKRGVTDLAEAWREGGLLGVVQEVWSDVSRALRRGWKALTGWVENTGVPMLADALRKAPGMLAARVPGWVTTITTKLGEVWVHLTGWVTNTGIPALLGAVESFRENVAPRITAGISALVDAFIENWPRVLNWLANDGVPKLVVKGAELVGGLVQGLVDAWPGFVAWIKENGWKLLLGALAYPAAVVTAGGAIVLGLINGLREVWATQLYPWIRDTLGWRGWQEFFRDAGTWLLQTGKDLIQGIRNGVVERWPLFSAWISARIADVKAAFAAAGTWLLQAGKDLIQGIRDGAVERWALFGAWVTAKVAEVKAAFAATRTWLLQAGKDLVQGIRDGAIERWQVFAADMEMRKNGLIASFANAKDWLLQAGKDLVQGLWDGVVARWEQFKADLGGLVQELPGWVKDMFGISVPATSSASAAPGGELQGLRFNGGTPSPAATGGAAGSRTINLTVNTQASDPEAVASSVINRLYGAMDRVGAGVA